MKRIYVAPNLALAHHLKALLQEVGIPAVVRGEFGGAESFFGRDQSAYPSVWVRDERYAELAAPLVRDFEQSMAQRAEPDPSPATWTCRSCGEIVEEQFGVCWKCGGDRPV